MDRHDPARDANRGDDSEANGTSSAELEKVRQALSVKIGKYAAHYADIKLLGEGSFGEVRSARDTVLGRDVAIKSLKSRFHDTDIVLERFLKEARGTAQLEHPNIMPVHEMGMSDEFGIYFTMKKIDGEDLKEILVRLQTNTSFYEKTYSRHLLLEIFLAVCNGVAFAHSRGVIHRDLKPANIMVGTYGEVLILDWGLVKLVDVDENVKGNVQLAMDEIESGNVTIDGMISGTPNYMSPEQADGRIKDIDFLSDVYSLGAILYHLLTYHPPFEKAPIRELLDNVKYGRFTPPRKRFPERKIPPELDAICMKAMSRHPVSRYRSVEELAQDVRNYIGHFDVLAYKAPRWVRFWKTCQRNPIKSSMAAAAAAVLLLAFGAQRAMLYGSYSINMRRAAELHAEGNALLAEAASLFDELEEMRAESELKEETIRERNLGGSFELISMEAAANYNIAQMLYESVPEPYRRKPTVTEGYVDIMQRRIEFALHCRQYGEARKWLETVRKRIAQPDVQVGTEAEAKLASIQDRIDGTGRLEIIGPESVHDIIVWPLLDVEGVPRKVQGDAIRRGKPPLVMDSIKKGSYVLQVTRGDGSMMPYPVYISHGEKKQLTLDLPGMIPEGMVYVPAGDFIFGGEDSRFYREQWRSLPAFYIKKHEVTVAEYLVFWKTLTDPDLKSDYMSRIRFHPQERRFKEAWDDGGVLMDDRIRLDYPVVGIPREAAEAFCEWMSRKTGDVIRLPTAGEWEKAARGVDGRRYVWGNGFSADANLTLTKVNEKGKADYSFWAPPGKFARDVSIYGAYDMAGNVREMTSTPLPDSETFYQLKGGSAFTPPNFLPCSYSSDTPVVPSDVGFRFLQEVPVKP